MQSDFNEVLRKIGEDLSTSENYTNYYKIPRDLNLPHNFIQASLFLKDIEGIDRFCILMKNNYIFIFDERVGLRFSIDFVNENEFLWGFGLFCTIYGKERCFTDEQIEILVEADHKFKISGYNYKWRFYEYETIFKAYPDIDHSFDSLGGTMIDYWGLESCLFDIEDDGETVQLSKK